MKYFVIAGEASGDLHGSRLIRAIKKLDETAEFRGMGGDMMIEAGLDPIAHIREFSIMGFVEVLLKFVSIRKLFKRTESAISDFKPDKVILIDYGGFNLRMAKRVKKMGIPVHYYILPKVWAWNEGRVKKIRDFVDFAYVIFPFEEKWFKQRGVNAMYVGNPVVSTIETYRSVAGKTEPSENHIALLPGSRKQEIQRILPVMLLVAERFTNFEFTIAIREKSELIPETLPSNVRVETGNTYHTVMTSRLALVTSGTANLETAMLNTPQVVLYKASPLSYWIGKRVVKVKFISPVNLILNRALITELIQTDCNLINLERETERLLDGESANNIRAGYAELTEMLTSKDAAMETASAITGIHIKTEKKE
ncbi:MAG: lipid-A-disaccharide synthase [Bacteroidetes bacterium]|nr:lipid-A-disaccharide synthase [Bacteroidota bacterium]